MYRIAGILGIMLCVGAVIAEECTGKLKKVDAEAKKITVTTEKDGDKEFTVDDNTKFIQKKKDKKTKMETETDLTDGLKNKAFTFKEEKAPNVTVITGKKDDKDVVEKVILGGGAKKKAEKGAEKEKEKTADK